MKGTRAAETNGRTSFLKKTNLFSNKIASKMLDKEKKNTSHEMLRATESDPSLTNWKMSFPTFCSIR